MPTDIFHGLEALVVDDEADVRELVAEYLRERGLQTATAHDGRAAVAALERSGGRFALVLTDINMPGADGLEVLRAARASSRRPADTVSGIRHLFSFLPYGAVGVFDPRAELGIVLAQSPRV